MDNIILFLFALIPASLIVYFVYERIRGGANAVDQKTYVEALRALLNDDDRTAFAKLRQVVSVDTSNVDAYLLIGNIFRRNGKPERALQIHQDLSVRHDLNPQQRADVYRAITSDYLETGDHSAAARSLQQFNEGNDNSAWGLETLLAIQEKTAQWDNALATAEKLLKVRGDMSRKPLAHYKVMIGQSLADEEQYHQARLVFKEALALDDTCADAYIKIGDTYMTEGRVEDAIGIWKRMVSNVPEKSGPTLDRLEKALFEVGKFGEIEDICRMVIRLDPGALEARLKLAAYFTKKSDFESAEEQLIQALENNRDSYLPALELARLYLKSKKEDKIHNLIGMIERKERQEREEVVTSR